ncbi:hypothetical protein ANN_00544 [Periplaneta americana]|uniref:Uncharacterized protein n=1 Tax=Periplaneta americana TaxID=6978 RepID=A0ABQ8TUA7_PERAM|nr:hypothetical protein ANN_00544 [Periplaneta americana]
MAGLCEGGNEPPGSLKASKLAKPQPPTTTEITAVSYYSFLPVVEPEGGKASPKPCPAGDTRSTANVKTPLSTEDK